MTNVSANGSPLLMNSRGILTESADNVLCSRLANACNAAIVGEAGDSIDRGLLLIKHLRQMGFGLIYIGEPDRNRKAGAGG